MPLLEVVQTRYVSASIRLTDTTALQVDQYAAFIHATADEVMEQALAYVFSKDRDFQEFLRSRPKPSGLRRHCACVAYRLPMQRSRPMASLLMPPNPAVPCGCRGHELPPAFAAEPLRRFAPEESRYSIPHRVLLGAYWRSLALGA